MNNVNPNIDPKMIDRIVFEVVSRLKNKIAQGNAHGNAKGNSAQTENRAGTMPSSQNVVQTGALSLDAKVISVETLRGKLDNVAQLKVRPKVVVTPAARDELRNKGVEIVFDQGVATPTGTATGQLNLILATTNKLSAEQAVKGLARTGINVQLKHDTCVKQLVTNLTGQLLATERLIVFVDQPYTAAYTANRNSSIRAAVVRDKSELKMAQNEINPNVIVIPADRGSLLDAVARDLVS